MNSIEFKGVSSTTIDGLIICELPPISKPPMRTKQTYVDGRHGARIEELGYSPYDKPVSIGLHGDFDINKVIKFFSGEGDIVFSNEPEKVYHGCIINQIDYNRLLRFRTAVVTFHVQPFKHKYHEAYVEAKTALASGTSLVFNDSTNACFKSFSIFGKSTQNGTPTPTAPIDIVSLGADGSVGVALYGENVAESTYITSEIEQYNTALYIETMLMPSTTYVLSFQGALGNSYYANEYIFASANVTISAGTTTLKLTTLSELDEKAYAQHQSGKGWVFLKNSKKNANHIFSNLMLCIGENKKDYATPISKQSMTFSYALNGIPVTDKSLTTYTDASGQMWCADEIDLKRGVLIKRIGEWVVDGTKTPTSFAVGNNGGSVVGYYYKDVMSGISTNRTPKMCDKLQPPTTTKPYAWQNCEIGCWSFNTGGADTPDAFLIFNLGTFASATEVTEYLKTNPLTFIGILEQPIETPLTEAEILACKSLMSNEPTTTITNDENAPMSVEYFKPYEVFNEGLEESKPMVVITGSGTIEMKVNGLAVFTYTFPDGEGEVVIDSEAEDAYLGAELKNRNMLGEFPVLAPKTNKIEWSGDVTSIQILPRSRWL